MYVPNIINIRNINNIKITHPCVSGCQI